MLHATEKHKLDLVEAITKIAATRLTSKNVKTVSQFIDNYYSKVALSDLAELSPEKLFGAVLAHWKLAAKRLSGKALVRVYNPNLKENGWDCEHTVIEIINDDMPFLVDSITSELNRLELTVHLVVHPVITVLRSKSGKMEGLVSISNPPPRALSESYMHLQITGQSGKQLVEIRKAIKKVIKDVRFAVEDWVEMRATMSSTTEELENKPNWVSAEDAAEAREFLRWAHDDHFTFLGHRDYDFIGTGKNASVTINRKSGLGILRTAKYLPSPCSKKQPPWTGAIGCVSISQRDLLTVTKTDVVSSVHRPVHME